MEKSDENVTALAHDLASWFNSVVGVHLTPEETKALEKQIAHWLNSNALRIDSTQYIPWDKLIPNDYKPIPDWAPPAWQKKQYCNVCGIELTTPMLYVCNRQDCPTFVRVTF